MKYIAVCLLLLLSVVPASAALRVGSPAPKIVLNSLKGAPLSIPDSLRGKVAIVHFWQAGCSSCKEDMPAMDGLFREYQRKGLSVIAVNVGQPRQVVQEAVAGLGISYPVLLDMERTTAAPYDIVGVPRTIIIDRTGIIRFKIIGSAPRSMLKKYLQSLL
ncbi:MAG: TlpA disulfide reductase family protein [Desulfuromonadaceae bacterium]|nr:TlpA disulfide reductase family protein [Desulfuromonadaceae bacterium]